MPVNHHPAHLLSPSATPRAVISAAERATHQICALRAVQRIYGAQFKDCARSPEWKAGALRGLRQRAGLTPGSCPYPSGTAQSDAWLAGNQAALAEWSLREAQGFL